MSMTVLTEDERKAMQWLERCHDYVITSHVADFCKHAQTLKRMLARPVLPKAPTFDALKAMRCATNYGPLEAQDAYRALYAHLTAPKTKEVEVWRVESAAKALGRWEPSVRDARSEAEAGEIAAQRKAMGERCIRVTGPHKQQVPA